MTRTAAARQTLCAGEKHLRGEFRSKWGLKFIDTGRFGTESDSEGIEFDEIFRLNVDRTKENLA